MLKKMSVALLAASILAAPALAAGGKVKPDMSAGQTQSTPNTQLTTGMAKTKSSEAKTSEAKPTVAKSHLRSAKITRHHRAHRHYAHRYHKKVKAMHASVKTHAAPKAKISFNKGTHKKPVQKVSFKRTTPALRRG